MLGDAFAANPLPSRGPGQLRLYGTGETVALDAAVTRWIANTPAASLLLL
jgi:hypothetical protein